MPDNPEERPPLAVGVEWASRITTIALEMVVPALLGYWIDRWLETPWIFVIIGGILGFFAGMQGLLQVAAAAGKRNRNAATKKEPPGQGTA